ncbi:proteinase-activated receptor 1 [Trichomycterus rosablanca]|uniref:proteinase-activated receptor 1 n=1 Tax=Trichomycterus rosablanca TaxID=2290929 RepID=UPI002F357D2E
MLPSNDTQNIARSFSGFFVMVTDEPFEYLDVQEGSGSGFNDREQRPVAKKHYYISKEASQFLTSHLATVFIPTVYVLVFIISVPLNLLALFLFVHRIRPKKPAAIYMLNLACADLLFVLLLPFRIAYHYNGNNWIYGAGMCRIVTAAFYCNMYCSVLLITCIAVDRFLAVVYPIDSLTWRSPRTASVACAAMWFLSIGGVMPLLATEHTVHLDDLRITTCHDVLDVEHLRGYYLYFFPVFCSLFFFIPFIFTTVCYIRIIQALCAAGVGSSTQKSRAVAMAATVFSVFAACFAPTNIILLTHYIGFANTGEEGSYVAYLVATCVGSVSCCIDPLVYYFGSSRCQKQILTFFRCRSGSGDGHSQLSSGSTRSSKLEAFKSNLGDQYKQLMA